MRNGPRGRACAVALLACALLCGCGDPTVEDGVVRGRVLTEHGDPIAGARVELHPAVDVSSPDVLDRMRAFSAPAASAAWAHATTDATGTFVVRGPRRNGVLFVTHAGFQWATREVAARVATGATPLDVHLLRGRTVEGRILDMAGKPVAGAVVMALRGDPAATPQLFRVGVGDEAGRYRLERLAPGSDVTMIVAAEGFPPSMVRFAHREATRDLVLDQGLVAARVRVHEAGVPVAGARVTATSAGGVHGAFGLAEAETDADGDATLPLPAGSWQDVLVRKGDLVAFASEPLRVISKVRIEDLRSTRRDETLELDVSDALVVHGRVGSADGWPLRGARVQALIGDELRLPPVPVGPGGRYRLRVRSKQRPYAVVASAPGWREEVSEPLMGLFARPADRNGIPRDFVLRPERNPESVPAEAPALEQQSASVRVRVLDPAGAALPDATVRILTETAGIVVSTMTDGEGRARLREAPAGNARVQAWKDGWAPEEEQASDGDAEVVIRVREEAPIRGIVIDAAGEPVAGARVVTPRVENAESQPLFAHATTAADGRFVLRGTPHGAITVSAWRGRARGGVRVESARDDVRIRLEE